jgi:hypothetical protein
LNKGRLVESEKAEDAPGIAVIAEIADSERDRWKRLPLIHADYRR